MNKLFLATAAATLTAGAALVPGTAHAQGVPKVCEDKTPTSAITSCAREYAAAHPSHDAYTVGPAHFRGRTGETITLAGGIAGDVYEMQYCQGGSWKKMTSRKVTGPAEFGLTMKFDTMPEDANEVRIRNLTHGITSFSMQLGPDNMYDHYFTGASSRCSAGSGNTAPSTGPTTGAPAPKGNGVGLPKTGF